MPQPATYLSAFLLELKKKGIQGQWEGPELRLHAASRSLLLRIVNEHTALSPKKGQLHIAYDQLTREPEKCVALLQSKLGLNERVFARSCKVEKIKKETAEKFLKTWHLMGATQSAWTYGLFRQEELLALASFSKGRKMRRLPDHLRSYELIRFCCKGGISVAGGLSKLLKAFIRDRQPGDIMTYVDAQWSDGTAFVRAGFRLESHEAPRLFLIHRSSLQRKLWSPGEQEIPKGHFLLSDAGNLKMILHVAE